MPNCKFLLFLNCLELNKFAFFFSPEQNVLSYVAEWAFSLGWQFQISPNSGEENVFVLK